MNQSCNLEPCNNPQKNIVNTILLLLHNSPYRASRTKRCFEICHWSSKYLKSKHDINTSFDVTGCLFCLNFRGNIFMQYHCSTATIKKLLLQDCCHVTVTAYATTWVCLDSVFTFHVDTRRNPGCKCRICSGCYSNGIGVTFVLMLTDTITAMRNPMQWKINVEVVFL